jgi:hypothetical protein
LGRFLFAITQHYVDLLLSWVCAAGPLVLPPIATHFVPPSALVNADRTDLPPACPLLPPLLQDAGVIAVHDSSAIMALLHPEIYAGSRVRVEVETVGEVR